MDNHPAIYGKTQLKWSIFNNYVSRYQRVNNDNHCISMFHHEPLLLMNNHHPQINLNDHHNDHHQININYYNA